MTSNVAFQTTTTYPHHTQQQHHHHAQHHQHNHHSQQQQQQQQWNDGDILPRPQAGSRRGETKDSRWLTLEVCADHLKGTCQKRDDECMMAHVPNTYGHNNGNGNGNNGNNNNSVNNGGSGGGSGGGVVGVSSPSCSSELNGDRRVMCCYDFIKGKCYRKDPPCKFFHPPPHLREVLLHNGRQNLLLKSQRSQLSYGAFPVLPSAVLPMVYNPTVLNPMVTAKMSEGAQIQFLSNHCVVNQGGMAYFYPFIVGADGWVTIPTNGIQGCQLVPSPPLHGSLKQVEQQTLPQLSCYDEVISPPWLQNGYSMPQAAMCGPFCYGYGQGIMKRPLQYDINKVQ